MNFTEAVNEVVTATRRPEKINRIRAKVNAAISFYCLDNEFPRDFNEQAIALNATEYTQAFDLSLLTRFRKFKFVKRGGTKNYLTVPSDKQIFEGCDLRDKYYIAGTNVNLYLAALSSSLDVGYYQYPALLNDVDNPSHWLLDVAPWMIIDRACAEIFREIGEDRDFKTMRDSAYEQYMAARKDLGISTQ
jgi:hypothetical protein